MAAGDYPDPESYTVGSEVAGYRLEQQIGRGGMALVYRARDVQLGRNVALKLLSPALGRDDAFRQRFIRESRAAAAVDHPHIIPIFAAGESDGVLFIAMRFVQGGDVRRLVDTLGPLPVDRAVSIITQVASALDAAHLHGLVHRDIKPANMLLDSTEGTSQQDHVYLADFGLSKRSLAAPGLSSTGLTSFGQFLGTPAYVAPEQVEGRTVDGRADQYALACAAFEMLSGSPPFERDDDLAIMWAQVSAAPPSLSERRPDLPPAVDTVLWRALAKEPADRYPACLAFAAALRAALGLHGRSSAGAEPNPTVVSGGPLAAPPGLSDHPVTRVSGPQDVPDHPVTQVSGPRAGFPPVPQAAPVPPVAPGPSELLEPKEPADRGPGRWEPPTEDWMQPVPPPRPPLGGTGRPPGSSRPAPPRRPAGRSGRPTPGRRGRKRWPIVVAGAAVVGLAIGAVTAFNSHGNEKAAGTADTTRTGGGTPAAVLPALTAPGCRSVVAQAPALTKVRTDSMSVGGQPFGVTTTADGKFTFVPRGDSIAVLANGTGLAPTLDHVISAPGVHNGAVLTHDGKYLIAAVNSGADVIDVAAAEQGSSHAIVGTLSSPGGQGGVEVAVSPNDQFVFVTLQYSAALAVFNLKTALTHGFGSALIGRVGLGQQPVGLTTSPDANWLYVTSMTKAVTQNPAEGTLTVIDAGEAETTPSKAVTATADAGCDPVRVIASGDGQTVWVTARESNALLGFSASRLVSAPAKALEAQVNVGVAPIGETFARSGNQTRILVADSNLQNQSGAAPNVAVVNPVQALRRRPALLGYVSTGQLPRQFTIQPNGRTALVTDNGAGQLQAIDLSTLP